MITLRWEESSKFAGLIEAVELPGGHDPAYGEYRLPWKLFIQKRPDY